MLHIYIYIIIIILETSYNYYRNINTKYGYSIIEIKSEPENNKLHHIVIFLNHDKTINSMIRDSGHKLVYIDINRLKKKEKLVLSEFNNRNILYLHSNNFNYMVGGSLIFKYLYNGAIKQYKEKYFELKSKNDIWNVYDLEENHLITNMRLKSKKIGKKLIGISLKLN